jgi:hypothetical protein
MIRHPQSHLGILRESASEKACCRYYWCCLGSTGVFGNKKPSEKPSGFKGPTVLPRYPVSIEVGCPGAPDRTPLHGEPWTAFR